ncbi:MAG: hypothetical protein ABJA57_12095 [Ginsengibacter sp.]
MSKYFYSDGSYAVASELQGNTGTYLSYDLGILKLGGGADILFSPGTDITVNGNLSHSFEISFQKNTCTISPTVQVNAGTQTFYRAYYKNRKFSFTSGGTSGNGGVNKSKGHHVGSTNSATNKITFPTQNRFGVLDYEISMPIQYESKRWGVYATPTASFPVNLATYAIDGVLQKENISKTFFAEVGAYFKF